MNKEQAEELRSVESIKPTVHASEFVGDRLLLDGYTSDRKGFKVFKEAGNLIVEISDYRNVIEVVSKSEWKAQDLVPDKRVLPETTDYEFAKLLRERGASFSVLPYSEERARHLI